MAVAVFSLCSAQFALAAAAAPGADMDYGPFLSGSLDRDRAVSEKHSDQSTEQDGNPNGLAAKAIVVRLGTMDDPAAVAFDTDLLRYAAGWTGGFVNLEKTHLATMKGSVPLAPAADVKRGDMVFTTPAVPGWSEDGKFDDPRPGPYGPLPKVLARYKGLYLHGDRVVFSYAVGDCDVLETPGFGRESDGLRVFYRTFRLSPTTRPLALLLCNTAPAVESVGGPVRAGLVHSRYGLPADATVVTDGGRAVLKLGPSGGPRVFTTYVTWSAAGSDRSTISQNVNDPTALTRGGPPRYAGPVVTRGRSGGGEAAYVVDTLTLPTDNPWKSWIRPSGMDFFSDGRLAVCTLNGDVWVVSGIDDKLERLEWRRFATGLYEPLGLKVVDDKVYVLGRDRITRLHDLNGDGEADFYENFNAEAPCSANYHGFAMDLATDAAGNFYYTRAGQRMNPKFPFHGALLRVSRDGSKLEAVAAGLRAANGLAVGPGDLITVADNQGNWTPSSRINVIKRGGFYGYMPHVTAAGGSPRADYDPPLCWIPLSIDNSSGSQAWSDPRRFGPLSNRLFHTSYGKASLMLVTMQQLDGAAGPSQGGVIPLPLKFDSGVMRGRTNPKDGQLYLCGLRGWQTAGTQDGAVVRVRYTGKPLYMATDAKVVAGGVELTFGTELDPETAQDAGSYGVEQWNYRWSAEYGSPDFSVKDPAKQGHDEVAVASAKLMPDRKTVLLSMPDVRPVMQMRIRVNLDAADGTAIEQAVYLTIHRVPG